ncbi:hypothetical protein Y032_0964g3231 [Ancylostoma ceylanicum]|uniref:Uncharacterized protein n=1 Tax=Ancylostoma ceylanicum TaxID=53326 RepID=A0A016W8C2_9BILA|nr:hypothetical protein Y032_0964g3231 [Ancylostoma ceylanicum]
MVKRCARKVFAPFSHVSTNRLLSKCCVSRYHLPVLKGAPKKRWKDTVTKDMRELGITKDVAQDRDLWRRKIKIAAP